MNRREPCCFSWYARVPARTAYVIVNNIYCIPAYVVWLMALRPLRPLLKDRYWKIEGCMFHWLLAIVSHWSWTAGYEIVESGDEPAACAGRRTLVLANHQSTADVPVLMAAWNPRPGLLANLMWIMDHVFKYTNFGIVSVLHEDFFIRSGRKNRDQSLEQFRRHIHASYVPRKRQFMVLFPEGGFLHKRRPISNKFAEKNNLPMLEYVTLPRAGAMKVIMDEVGPYANRHPRDSKDNSRQTNSNKDSPTSGDHIEWILDVTIAYEKRIPLHLYDIVCGLRAPCTTHIHYRLYPSTDVPNDPEEMTQWLYDRFVEKDAMLETYYRTGKFPPRGDNRDVVRPVRQDLLQYIILHIFFIASTLLQLRILVWLYYLW